VAVACPFCNIMLTDGMKSKNMEDKVQVLDIAELVALSISSAPGVDVPVSNLVRKRDR
jgi:Fe-S oxidoreductase